MRQKKKMGLYKTKKPPYELPSYVALYLSIEQHEAFKQEVSDALKKARGAINGLLDIASEENLDSEQAGRAYAALHEIGTALAALEARGLEIREKGQ
jgi:hypothetical protein